LEGGVESVEPHAEHRALDTDVLVRHDEPAIFLRRNRRVLEVAPLELLVHRVEVVTAKDAVHDAGESGRAIEVVGVGYHDDFLAGLPAEELEGTGTDWVRAEGVALLLDELLRQDLGMAHRQDG